MEMKNTIDENAHGSSGETFELIQPTASPMNGRNAIDMVAEGTTVRGHVASPGSAPKDEDDVSDTIRGEAAQASRNLQPPLSVSSREGSFRSASTLAADFDFGGERFAVVIPPVSRRWEYKTYDVDPRVKSIVEEVQEGEQLSYVVKSRDGRTSLVSISTITS